MTFTSTNKVAIFMTLLALLSTVQSLSTKQKSTSALRTSSSLRAWSLQIPDNFHTWYNEVDNPTARKTIYDDTPNEYRFVAAGSDWPSFNEMEESQRSEDEPRFCFNPIRRARQWIARRRR